MEMFLTNYKKLILFLRKANKPKAGDTVQTKHNVALTRKCAIARASIVANYRGVALVLLTSMHPVSSKVNTS